MSAHHTHIPSPVHPTSPGNPQATLSTVFARWHTLAPAAFEENGRALLCAALLQNPALLVSDWFAAREADPVASLPVGHVTLAFGIAHPERVDVALSAVALCAALVDPRCCQLLVIVLARRARSQVKLDTLYLAYALRRVLDQQAGVLAGRVL